jgi:hypothetical protein
MQALPGGLVMTDLFWTIIASNPALWMRPPIRSVINAELAF